MTDHKTENYAGMLRLALGHALIALSADGRTLLGCRVAFDGWFIERQRSPVPPMWTKSTSTPFRRCADLQKSEGA